MPKVSIFAGTRNACHCLIACTSLDESSDARCCQIQETSCVSGSRQSPDQSSDGGFSCGISRACVAFLKTIGFLVFRSFGSYLQLFALAGLLSIRLGSSWMKAQSIGFSYAISGGTAMPRATRIETKVL